MVQKHPALCNQLMKIVIDPCKTNVSGMYPCLRFNMVSCCVILPSSYIDNYVYGFWLSPVTFYQFGEQEQLI